MGKRLWLQSDFLEYLSIWRIPEWILNAAHEFCIAQPLAQSQQHQHASELS